MPYTIEQINEAFDKIPPELVSAMAMINVNKKIADIGKKFSLHVDALGEIAGEINMALVGLARAEDFPARLREIIKLPEDQFSRLISEINESIFEAIRKKVQLASVAEEETEEIPATSPAAPYSSSAEDMLRASGVEVVSGTSSIPKMAEEKLSGTFRLPAKETDLSINKNAKAALETRPEELPSPGVIAPQDKQSLGVKIDPYREKV